MSIDDEAKDLGGYLKAGLIIFLFFIISGFKSCSEIKYKISGVKTDAVVIDVQKSVSTRRSRNNIDVKYSFADKVGANFTGYMTISGDDWQMPESGKINVTYVSSDPNNSIATSDRSNVWFLIFLVIAFSFIAFLVKFWMQVQNDVKVNKGYK